MYETLTRFIPLLGKQSYGEWVFDKENDGSAEHPIQMPFVSYGDVVHELETATYDFVASYPELKLKQYGSILKKQHIKWDFDAMLNADVSQLDGTTVVALIFGAIRADRFCEGILMRYLKEGAIGKWLKRLQEIDNAVMNRGDD